jgi:hypothetical protein
LTLLFDKRVTNFEMESTMAGLNSSGMPISGVMQGVISVYLFLTVWPMHLHPPDRHSHHSLSRE